MASNSAIAGGRDDVAGEFAGAAPLGRVVRGGGWRAAWLALRVHCDAFMLDPRLYAKALVWRLRGLKVRSRNAIAPLKGRSPRAYALWMRRQQTRTLRPDHPLPSPLSILAVVDCRAGAEGLSETLGSLADAGGACRAVVIGSGPSGVERISHPRELADLVDSSGASICALDPGDRLSTDAFARYAAARAQTIAAVIYADDDLLQDGVRHTPHFKTDWNPDLFRHHDYISGASLIHATPAQLKSLPDEPWSAALINVVLGAGAAPFHIPEILHHRRRRPAPTIPPRPAPLAGAMPRVSVIIPTRNQLALLRTCLDGVERVRSDRVETIIIDNGSDDGEVLSFLESLGRKGIKVLNMPGPFNYSRINNAAVAQATGEFLCFLNNDVEMVDDRWLDVLVGQAMRPELGAVGARLLYPDGTIQHAGVFTGIGGGAGHGHRHQREEEAGYFHRARLPQQVSAVTAACLVVARDKFLAVGGFDEQDFPVAFNDVDLCLKLNARGWQSFYEPRATLIHHESKSRGSDSARAHRTRFAGELAALKRKWRTDKVTDPYHHPHLSRFSEQFVIAV